MSVKETDAEVLRHMRPTLSELGEYDGCALMEFKTRKEIVYLLNRKTVCTYELDDTPPFEIDPESVDIAIEMALLFNLNLVSELHVMRKQYLDGSIPTGFQRTTLVGIGGTIPFRVPELGIDRDLQLRQLSLEEDSCREVSDLGHRVVFRTDRLGTPLTETVTEPVLLTPLELQAGARLLAHTAQTSQKVLRGVGAARQDVNVSVAGGRRVELKGVSHHRRLPELVHTEALRQLNLLRIKAELEERGLEASTLYMPLDRPPWESSALVCEATSIVRATQHPALRASLQQGQPAYALRLPGFKGLLTHRTQPGLSFAHELTERLRVIACLTYGPFLLHSDLTETGLSNAIWKDLKSELKSKTEDSIVVVWGPADDMEIAVHEVYARAAEASQGVPSETRQAHLDGRSGFERILPGPERMYPDTDTPPLPISDTRIHAIEAELPERPWEREQHYQTLGLTTNQAQRLSSQPWATLFEILNPQSEQTARRLATGLEKRLPHLMRRGVIGELPEASRLAPLVHALDKPTVRHEACERLIDLLLIEAQHPADEIIAQFMTSGNEAQELRDLLKKLAPGLATLKNRNPQSATRWAMGELMPKLLGRMDPKEVLGSLAAIVSEHTA